MQLPPSLRYSNLSFIPAGVALSGMARFVDNRTAQLPLYFRIALRVQYESLK